MFNEILFRPELVNLDHRILFRFCRPKILVVTDGLSFNPASGFGLSQFVDTLKSGTIYGQTPSVVTAHRGIDATADIQSYDFTNASNGLTINRYDVVFLFGINRETSPLPASQVDAIMQFMQAGGGVFATGDHEDLGAGLCKDIPRVRNMRHWLAADTPDFGDTTRLSTNLPGDNDIYEFDDQSDTHPQRLYVNYRTAAGGVGSPHPLLQGGPLGPVEVFPDHPHEGECVVPTNLNTTFTLSGNTLDEWPQATVGGGRVSPEPVALSVSHGNAFPGKDALVPRSYLAISAYDGHRAGVGRVSTDATWHHFVNINIDGTGSARDGLQSPPGTDTPDMARIREYYKNLSAWLMPARRRLCISIAWVIREVLAYPLFEEVRVPQLDKATPEQLHLLGEQTISALASAYPQWQAASLEADALSLAVGEANAERLLGAGRDFGRLSGREVALSAVGGLVAASVARTLEVRDQKEVDVEKTFVPDVTEATKLAVERYRSLSMDMLQDLQRMFTDTLGSLNTAPQPRRQREPEPA